MIGAGFCTNAEVSLRTTGEDYLLTAQDFGCVLHESKSAESPGIPSVYNPEAAEAIIKEFLDNLKVEAL